jgi:hypothetical protein
VRQWNGPKKWRGGREGQSYVRRTGPVSFDVQVGTTILSRHAHDLRANRAHLLDIISAEDEERKIPDSTARLEPQQERTELPSSGPEQRIRETK